MNSRIAILLGLCCFPMTCRSNASPVEGERSISADTTSVVDSILPIEEALRRFRADIPTPVTHYSAGASSKDALVKRFMEGIARRDTVGLAKLAVSRAEFAYLYYPNHPQSLKPYEVSPQLMWFQMTARSDKGLRRVLQDFGGKRFAPRYSCADSTQLENQTQIWTQCVVKGIRPDKSDLNLFSAIVERDGAYKFLSYANSL